MNAQYNYQAISLQFTKIEPKRMPQLPQQSAVRKSRRLFHRHIQDIKTMFAKQRISLSRTKLKPMNAGFRDGPIRGSSLFQRYGDVDVRDLGEKVVEEIPMTMSVELQQRSRSLNMHRITIKTDIKDLKKKNQSLKPVNVGRFKRLRQCTQPEPPAILQSTTSILIEKLKGEFSPEPIVHRISRVKTDVGHIKVQQNPNTSDWTAKGWIPQRKKKKKQCRYLYHCAQQQPKPQLNHLEDRSNKKLIEQIRKLFPRPSVSSKSPGTLGPWRIDDNPEF